MADESNHKRRQYPFRLAYAVTIHSAQGDTYGKTVVDLGGREVVAGLSYVALSRVKHISELCVIGFHFDRLGRIENSSLLQPRMDEENRLNKLVEDTLEYFAEIIEEDMLE